MLQHFDYFGQIKKTVPCWIISRTWTGVADRGQFATLLRLHHALIRLIDTKPLRFYSGKLGTFQKKQ